MKRRLLYFSIALGTTVAMMSGCSSSSKGSGNSGNTTGDSGSTADAGVPCGAKSCHPPAGVTAAMCCKDAFAGTCGYKSGDQCVDKAPPPPSKCPGVSAMGFTLAGCCVTATNQCGLDTSSFGGGCVDSAIVKAQASQFVKDAGASVQFPAPQACPQ